MTADVTMQTLELYDATRAFKAAVNQYVFTCHPADHLAYQQTGAAFNTAVLETMAQLPYSADLCDQWEAYDLAVGAFARYSTYEAAQALIGAVNVVAETLLVGFTVVMPTEAA